MPEHIPCSRDSAEADGLRPDAFLEDAMHRWGDTVLRLALSQLRDASDAEDVFQDVFVRLLKDRTAFNDDEHLKAWLLRVTVNRCRDLARSGWKRRTVALDPEWDAPDAATSRLQNAMRPWPSRRPTCWNPTSGTPSAPSRPTCAPWCTCTTWRAIPPTRRPPSWDAAPPPRARACTAPAST